MKKLLLLATAVAYVASASAAFAQESDQTDVIENYKQAHCLAQNIYFEARGSNFADKVSVADVVLNRARDSRYPNTPCEVISQGFVDSSGNMVRNQCQFSWYCDGKSDVPEDETAWEEAMLIAWNMVHHGRYRGLTEGATHYHATYVKPGWASDFQLVGRIGDHVYYRQE
jgi:N-acetylmuramoyl-L-alanine amidase